ncbi:hypothetical protein [Sphingomonas sp. UYP23]
MGQGRAGARHWLWFGRGTFDGRSSTIRCPVMVGVGRQDVWSPHEQSEAIAAAIADARYAIF